MLSKELTPNPKAVNIIRPTSDFQFISNLQTQLNYSSSTDSSSFSTASTNNIITLSPMIRQPSMESNPGLSFFCQTTTPTKTVSKPQLTSFEKIQSPQPLVISRINLTQRRPTVTVTDSDIDLDDEEETIDNDNIVTEDISPVITHNNMVRLPSYKPGFGIMSGTGFGSFMLRGNITQQVTKPDEARVNRKIEDLEIEKKSLLTLNHTLETVVKEQSNTISDLKDRLAAIERPLTPGLDTSLSKNGIMSSADILGSDDLERYLEDEDAAFERIRIMLLGLIEQAQSAVTTQNVDYDLNNNANTRMKRNGGGYVRPKSVAGMSSNSSRNLTIPNQQRTLVSSRRVSLGNIETHNNNNGRPPTTTVNKYPLSSSPNTSPIPNRRYSIQRSSSPALLKKSSSNSSMQSATSRTSKKSVQQETRKWQN